ncbi:hypothetical protein ACFE04_022088 [Oxalis oulophora]
MSLATEYSDDSAAYINESVTSYPSNPPHFRCLLTREFASGTIPFPINSEFIIFHPELLQDSVIAILQTSSSCQYHCQILRYQYGVDTIVYLGTGWHIFTILENLRGGDILDFHLLEYGIFPLFNVEVSRRQ